MLRTVLLALVCLSAGCTTPTNDEAPSQTQDEAALTSVARPTKLADLEGGLDTLRLSPTHVYFHDHAARAVRRVSKLGGAVETILQVEGSIRDFALDGIHLYAVIDRSSGQDWKFGEVVRTPLAGGPVEPRLGGDLALARIAVDTTDVYVAAQGKLVRFPKSGNFVAPEPLEDDAPHLSALTVDATHVYWADMGPGNPAIGCNLGDGRIMARPKRGGPARIVARGQDCPLTIAIEGGQLWFRSFFGPLRKVNVAGGPTATVAANTFTGPAFDATSVFFSIPAGVSTQLESQGKLSGAPKSYLGTRTDTPQQTISAVVVDTMNAYYAVTDHGRGVTDLLRVAKQ
jgi:hypothetical protein